MEEGEKGEKEGAPAPNGACNPELFNNINMVFVAHDHKNNNHSRDLFRHIITTAISCTM